MFYSTKIEGVVLKFAESEKISALHLGILSEISTIPNRTNLKIRKPDARS